MKYPEEPGKGAIEGVAEREAANNASAAGTLVPPLTLGLPIGDRRDDARGLPAIWPQPGPAAVRRETRSGLGPDREPVHRQSDAAGIEPSAGRPLVRLLAIPQPWLYAGILVFATMGTIAA